MQVYKSRCTRANTYISYWFGSNRQMNQQTNVDKYINRKLINKLNSGNCHVLRFSSSLSSSQSEKESCQDEREWMREQTDDWEHSERKLEEEGRSQRSPNFVPLVKFGMSPWSLYGVLKAETLRQFGEREREPTDMQGERERGMRVW